MPPERRVRKSTVRKSNPTDTVRKPTKTTNKKLDILVFAVVIAHGGDFFDVSCLQNIETNKQCSKDAVVNLSTSVLTRNIHLYSNIPYGHYNLTTPCKNLQPVFTFSDVIYCAQHSRGEKLALQEKLINEALKKPLLPTSEKLGYIIQNLNRLPQTQNAVEHLRFDNKTPSEKYKWDMRPLVTEVYFFNKYPSKAAKAPLKSISEMPFSGSLLSYNVTEKDDDISGIFIYTYGLKRIDITDLSQFESLHITIRDKSFSLISLILKYIEWWNQYVRIISENEIEKNIRKQPFGTYFANQLTHFNLIELSGSGRRITKINNESVYHLINIILNFQTYDDAHSISKKIIDTVIDFFSIKFLNKKGFLVQSNFFLNQMCHSFNVDLHIFNNACRSKINQIHPSDITHMSELNSLQTGILTAKENQDSQSQSMEIGGKKNKTRKYKK